MGRMNTFLLGGGLALAVALPSVSWTERAVYANPPIFKPCFNADRDGDGHNAVACGGDDCNDADPNTYPGNPEVCRWNGTAYVGGDHDEDCDPTTFSNASTHDGDRDRDGYVNVSCYNLVPAASAFGASDPLVRIVRDGASFRLGGTDCDDGHAAIHEGAQVCTPDGTGVKICSFSSGTLDGWEVKPCGGRSGHCVPQPNGTGVCVN